jgi:hypothetical protein
VFRKMLSAAVSIGTIGAVMVPAEAQTTTPDQAAFAFIDKERAALNLLPVPPNGDTTFPLKMEKDMIEVAAHMVMMTIDGEQFIKEAPGQYQYHCDRTKPNWKDTPCSELFQWRVDGKDYLKMVDHNTGITDYCVMYKSDVLSLCNRIKSGQNPHILIRNTKTEHYGMWEYTLKTK